MTCDESRERFVQALYDELTGDEKIDFARHLTGCVACSSELAAMRETLAVMDKRQRADGPGDQFWERLAPKLGDRRPAPLRPLRRPAAMPAWAFGIAATVILACGIYLGKMYFGASAPSPAPAASTAASNTDSTTAAAPGIASVTPQASQRPVDTLDARALAYIERSRNLLLGVVNADEVGPADFARAQATSRRLIEQSHFLKAALTEPDQQQMKRLILELEVILLQLANVEAAPGTPAIELVRQGVDKKSILLKINLEEIRATANRPAAQPTGKHSL